MLGARLPNTAPGLDLAIANSWFWLHGRRCLCRCRPRRTAMFARKLAHCRNELILWPALYQSLTELLVETNFL